MVRDTLGVQNSHIVNNTHSYLVVPADHNKGIPLYPLPLPTFDNKHHVLGAHNVIHNETRYAFLATRQCTRYLRGCRTRHRSMESRWRQDAHRAHDHWYNRIQMTWMDDQRSALSKLSSSILSIFSAVSAVQRRLLVIMRMRLQ